MQTVSFSEIDTARQCPFKWKLAYDERWVGGSSPALDKGSLWHLVEEAHYKVIKAEQSAFENTGELATEDDIKLACADAVSIVLDQVREAGGPMAQWVDLIEWMYVGYVQKYGIDDQWRILSVESTHIIPLFELDGTEATDFNLKIKVDLLATDERDRLWVIDHKSASRIPRDEKDFQFLDQFGLYEFGLRQLGYRVCGTIHNGATTKQNQGDIIMPGDPGYKSTMKPQTLDARMHRTPMTRTDRELINIQYEALTTARKMYSATEFERHADDERCKWKCNFTEACLIGRRNGNERVREYLVDTGYTQEFARH